MLDLKMDRDAVAPKDAATVVLVRDGEAGLEVFIVERSKASKFMGGAIVFPGGKVDAADADAAWAPLVRGDADAHRIAACRETLEEACILHTSEPLDDATLAALRARLAADPGALRAFLAERGLKLDLAALHPLSRWITPTAEARRFDARFFVAIAPPGQAGAHDAYETVRSFWATPAEVLRRWEAAEVQMAPPTHATIALLATVTRAADAIATAAEASLEPVCPKLVPQGDTLALVLPGDPEHEVKERRLRVPDATRYVLRGERWVPADAPR
ncbi:MAG: hypothetical protein KIT84_18490 [Labilithrix sp.]|nr:hypothetical protein [Labilithrix sp.]MCW5813023.1 hypothetical protein [Labilithrix sp.]